MKDSLDDIYAILAISNYEVYVLRFDRISGNITTGSLLPTPDPTEEKIINHILHIAPQVWGRQFRGDSVHVVVRFYNEANVFKKVKRDLITRTMGTLCEKDGYLYYEDDVYGLTSFRRYISSYGSSAIIQEPKWLREEVIASLRKRIANYSNNIK